MDKVSFLSLFDKIIDYVTHEIEAQDKSNLLDFDSDAESLTISYSAGTLMINRQVPSMEIWLSSPKIGPKHFKCTQDGLITYDGLEFFDLLSKDLSIKFSKKAFNSYE